MASSYSVTISIDTTTVQKLMKGKFNLYGFKAAQGPGGGAPVVWFSTNDYSENTVISWSEQYYAYSSSATELTANTKITASAQCSIDLGQLATIGLGGVLTPTEDGDRGAVTIYNSTMTDYTCGVSQAVVTPSGGTIYNPMCAFPILSGTKDEIVPIEQVFLMFATDTVDTGTVLEKSFGFGAMIDLTTTNDMNVSYDMAKVLGGWDTPPGVVSYPPSTVLLPLLNLPQQALAAG